MSEPDQITPADPMSLDPVILQFMRETGARVAALPQATSPAESREQLDRIGDTLYPDFAEAAPGSVTVEDRIIPGPGPDIPVRIYRPAAATATRTQRLGIHIYLHGGGWWQGSTHDWVNDVQAAERAAGVPCVVVAVEYRLAPEHPFPAGLDDVVAAVRWVTSHAADVASAAQSASASGDAGGSASGDAGSSAGVSGATVPPEADDVRISIGGNSAGANLAAAALLRLRDEFAGERLPGFAVFEVGVFDFSLDYSSFERYGTGFALEAAMMPGLGAMYLPDLDLASTPYVSPVRAATLEGFPPSHFVTAQFDPTHDTSDAFADRLAREGVPVTRYRGLGHIHQSSALTKLLPSARAWRADVLDALRHFHSEA